MDNGRYGFRLGKLHSRLHDFMKVLASRLVNAEVNEEVDALIQSEVCCTANETSRPPRNRSDGPPAMPSGRKGRLLHLTWKVRCDIIQSSTGILCKETATLSTFTTESFKAPTQSVANSTTF